MFKVFVFFTFAVCGIRCAEDNIKVPEWLKLCARDDDIDDCLKESIQEALSHLTNGIPAFKLPPLDPYFVKEMTMEYKRNQINVRTKIANVNVNGLSTSRIKGVRTRFHDDKFKMEVDVFTPGIFVECDYKVDGRIQALRIGGKGYSNTSMHDLTYTWKISGVQEANADGKTYIKINDFWMRPDVGDMKVYMSNLFPGNVDLSRLGNNLANQYWRLIYVELLPYVETFWNEIGVREANRIFQNIPLDRLFREP